MAVPRCRCPHRSATFLLPALLSTAVLLAAPPSAQAGLLRPLLDLLQPQLASRLSRACVQQLADGDGALATRLEQPCQRIAAPTSRCLIDETDRSGRGLGVLTELLAGRFGDDSAVVVKRCLTRQLGLPEGSLDDLPLRELVGRYSAGVRR